MGCYHTVLGVVRGVGPASACATLMTIDRWQLSAGLNFSAAPWHRAPYVSCISDVCFICFIWMLHAFHLDVAYIAMAIHAYCKCIVQMFDLFQTYVASVFI
jgi:hypothetical protein